MSGRGEWWEVTLTRKTVCVMGMTTALRPKEFAGVHIDKAVATMAHRGEADAIAAVLECPDDITFQLAVRNYK